MSAVALLIFYVTLALGVSFLCSVLEAVLLSITPTYVVGLEAQGSALGEKLRDLKANVDRPLAAILSLNTVAHTVGAAGAGAQAQEIFGSTYVAVISGVLTLLILIFSEIIPKTLGAKYWKKIAPAAATILPFLILLSWPLVKLSEGISKLMGGSGHHGPTMSRAEFEALTAVSTKDGILQEEEGRILANLFRLGELRAKDVMTPRIVMMTHEGSMTVKEALEHPKTTRFSRIPIRDGRMDQITGFVRQNDILLKSALDQHEVTLDELRRDILVLPSSTNIQDTLEQMLKDQEHIALLVDEYGGTEGLVTLEDLVETVLGLEIVDESDADADMQHLAREQWKKRALRLGLIEEEAEVEPEDAQP